MLRFGLLAALFAGNPLLYAWWQTTGGLFPDSLAYLMLARELIQSGQLFISGYGHVDAGLILPPLYPLLIGVGTIIYGDAILVSQWLSGLCLLLATIPLFLWVQRATNVWLAAAATALVQWQPVYFLYGTSTLTEGLFLLGVCTLGFAAACLTSAQRSHAWYFLLGLGACLLFLVRQLGLFMLPLLIVLIVLQRWLGPADQEDTRPPWTRIAAILAGFSVLAVPYAVLLYVQSSQLPWTPSFRLNQYVVTESSPGGAEPVPTAMPTSYTDALIERRKQRALNVDGTEMLGNLIREPRTRLSLLDRIASPAEWIRNVWRNLEHGTALLGPAAMLAAAVGALLSFRVGASLPARASRIALVGTVGAYLGLVSALTGLVARYVEVIAPLVIALGFVGVHELIRSIAPRRLLDTTPFWIAIALCSPVLFPVSDPASGGAKVRKYGETTNPVVHCVPLVDKGSGVFAFHPYEAYILGGSYRVIPNDSLDRVATYARRTGTRWLVFRDSATSLQEAILYDRATWVADPGELFTNANFIPRCKAPDSATVLFEIADTPAARDGPRS